MFCVTRGLRTFLILPLTNALIKYFFRVTKTKCVRIANELTYNIVF